MYVRDVSIFGEVGIKMGKSRESVPLANLLIGMFQEKRERNKRGKDEHR